MGKTYTGKGDAGQTTSREGDRVSKDSAVIIATGRLDEAEVALGYALAGTDPEVHGYLAHALKHAMDILAYQVLSEDRDDDLAHETAALEVEIDAMDSELPKLVHFIRPTGCELACRLHAARVMVRRLERGLVAAEITEPLAYINRLSTFLFVAARYANHLEGYSENR
jgi:cob(I)alamin adenosyltransferase